MGLRKPSPGQGQKAKLNPDEAQAMMNMLRSDQKRYEGAFQPIKKRQKQPDQDPMEQMMEQMTGVHMPRPPVGNGQGGDVKDW